jgi:HK97 family phage prohead protease
MSDLRQIFIPVEDLPYSVKDVALADCEIKILEEGIVTGYAATFHKKPDLGGDVIEPGAFLETIKNGGVHGNGIKVLWQHQHMKPIGIPLEMKEDKRGLFVKTQLGMETQDGHDAFIWAKMGAIDGHSIGYKIYDFRRNDEDKNKVSRYLKKLGLYEYSFVTFAMNPRAGITNVKTAIKTAKTERELERALRDAGLSKSEAQYVVALCKPKLRLAGEGNLKDLLKTIQSVNADLLLTHILNSAGSGKEYTWEEMKPYANEHSCRLQDPGKYKKFRRQNNAATVDGKRIDFIYGILAANKSELQAIRYPKDIWEASSARSHCKSKGGNFEQASGKFVCNLE